MSQQKEQCGICQRAGKRFCPALDGAICPSCCGAKRGSEIACASDCVHYPFSSKAYDLWLRVDGELHYKSLDYIMQNCGKDCFEEAIARMSTKELEEQTEDDFVVATGAASYFCLFVKRDRKGLTLADQWQAQDWKGLHNDERLMMHYRMKTQVTIVEVQKILNHQTMECMDLLDPKHQKFIALDRKTASRAVRFTQILTWLTHYPHFSRIEHGGAEISDWISEEYMEVVKGVAPREAKRHRGYDVKQFLSENFGVCCRAALEMAREKAKRVLDSMDAHHCVATFEIAGSRDEIKSLLEKYPEFDREDREPGKTDPPGTQYYHWLRLGDSKEIEKQMSSWMRHEDPRQGVGTLGNVRLYPDKLVIETLTKQKFEFAKKMVQRYFGKQVTLKQESVIDIAKQMAQRMERDEKWEKPEEEQESAIPPEMREQAMKEYFKQHYERFLGEELPFLGNHSPREAARDPNWRPQLIELMKRHLKNFDKQNRENETNLSIDWVLDELDLQELK